MYRRATSILIALTLPTFFGACSRASGQSVEQYVRAEMERQHIPGLALAIVRGGRVIRAEGFGVADREQQTPVTPQTVFKIGSVSKQFLAAGIMLLVQEGRVAVDDPVSKYLDGTPESWRGITIRHLLTHTSGIRREGPAFTPAMKKPDIDVVRSAYALPLDFETGTEYRYCNVCYFALAEIIARVSGRPWSTFMQERVFAPAGMTATATTADPINGLAHAYDWRDDAFHHTSNFTALRPSGAFVSTVLDLAKWDSVLYTDAPLTRATKEQMWSRARLKNGAESPYGFGWRLDTLDGRWTVHHGGSLTGFQSQLTRIPKDSLTIIVLTNSDDARPDRIARGVAEIVLRQRGDTSAIRPP